MRSIPKLEAQIRGRADASGLSVEAFVDFAATDELEALAQEGLNS